MTEKKIESLKTKLSQNKWIHLSNNIPNEKKLTLGSIFIKISNSKVKETMTKKCLGFHWNYFQDVRSTKFKSKKLWLKRVLAFIEIIFKMLDLQNLSQRNYD